MFSTCHAICHPKRQVPFGHKQAVMRRTTTLPRLRASTENRDDEQSRAPRQQMRRGLCSWLLFGLVVGLLLTCLIALLAGLWWMSMGEGGGENNEALLISDVQPASRRLLHPPANVTFKREPQIKPGTILRLVRVPPLPVWRSGGGGGGGCWPS